MNTKQLIGFATLALAGTAVMADDITIVADNFVATKSRAEVKAEVLQARAAGVLQFATERDVQVRPTRPVMPSGLTREEVRAELLKSPRVPMGAYNPAA